MDWQPKARIMASPAPNVPTKPPELGFVGFVGSPEQETSIIRGSLSEKVAPPVDTTEPRISAMPPGVRLIEWELKGPPIAFETCAVVFDPALFAFTTLEQLRIALAQPKRWVGWSIPQLIDRLAQVGVRVALEQQTRVAKF